MGQKVAFLVYPEFSLINLSGPASVFETANYVLGLSGKKPLYTVEVLSPTGGPVTTSGGITMHTRSLGSVQVTEIHTALVVGAHMEHVLALTLKPRERRWAVRCAKSARRFGSVCTGAFVLAELGLLDGKRAATHWFGSSLLAERYPLVTVDADALFVVDGKTWTSAGSSAGIDMALAMVSEDLGDSMAGQVAKGMVLYARRPGYQSQFSPLLIAQAKADGPFAELTGWLQANLHRPLDVPSLAARVGFSERTFYRKFVAATGESPAHFIQGVRLDAARMLLSQELTLKEIAAQVGLAPTARFTRAFEHRFGISPNLFREMHTSARRARTNEGSKLRSSRAGRR